MNIKNFITNIRITDKMSKNTTSGKKVFKNPEIKIILNIEYPQVQTDYSPLLKDRYIYCPDNNIAQKLRIQGYPVYSNESVLTMMLSGDGGYNDHLYDLHRKYKKLAFQYGQDL